MPSPLRIQAGRRAYAHLAAHGLRAADIAVIPAAAGGPKGLILSKLDAWLFGSWLPSAPRQRSLLGASIGAWRMAAACQPDAARGFAQLAELYCEQRYSAKPSEHEVTQACQQLLHDWLAGQEQAMCQHAQYRLHIFAVRGKRFLKAPQKKLATQIGFAAAALNNLASRAGLARHMSRVILGDVRDPLDWLPSGFDAFHTEFAPLQADNLAQSLLTSGTLPLIMQPVRNLRHAPAGTYWDGGLIDYHLALPYANLLQRGENQLVLYPHFDSRIVPGWFDKALPWRRALPPPQRAWLDNVILLSPSHTFVQSLPRQKLPDRQDFLFHGQQHATRIRDWQQAIQAGAQLRDALQAFIAKPDMGLVEVLN